MRKILLFIGCLLVLGAVVPGCDRVPRYDGRLTALDSLMRGNPDSVVAVLEALTADSFASEGDHAYRDLLLTQARYKAYITATSDSDINRALAYFSAHPSDREKLTRAYIYKGAVMDELGLPDSAMLYYKTAEATAAPDDYFNLGYCNLRIGELYQSFFVKDSVVIARMKRATSYFTAINDTSYLITTFGTQGAVLYNSGSDSAIVYLKKALSLAEATKSPKRFDYQSKLAGYYFYKEDFTAAKNLAMDIIMNGAEECDEDQFYYYAARSFIELSRLDSAYYVISMIPAPSTLIDSMNHYMLLAELAKAEHHYQKYAEHLTDYKQIYDRIHTNSLKSNIDYIEIKHDADTLNKEYKKSTFCKVFLISVIVVLAFSLFLFLLIKRIKGRILKYQEDIDLSRAELEKTIELYEARIAENEMSIAKQKVLLEEKDQKITEVTKENDKLLSRQTDVNDKVSKIVRNRLAAINELYQEIRVNTSNNAPYKRSLPLISLIKELNEKKQLSIITPKDSFWKKLRSSIDDEYQGLATFVEERYPSLTTKELHLFWLLCAKISPQIIKLCMDYSNAATVSNYKKKLIQVIMGHDMKFEEFIQSYLDGKLD